MTFPARRRSVFTLLTAFSTLLVGGALYSRLRAQESSELTQIAPGVSLLSVSAQSTAGPLRYWLVKADKSAVRAAIEVADARDVKGKKSVRALAAQAGALVAVNGGFFAYDGAAVGAVKALGEWQRLPWKSRTALGWNDQNVQIGALSGGCRLTLTLDDGTELSQSAALNGGALPGTHASFTDGFAVLTPRFANKWKGATSESGAVFVGGEKSLSASNPREIAIPEAGFVLIARGAATQTLNRVRRATWQVETAPPDFNRFPQILGAGPLLIQNGLVKTTETLEKFRPDVLATGPRTCVGFDAQGNWLLLVVNGWQTASLGLTLPETARLFQRLGAVQAMNLDGGGSTQLVVQGEFINPSPGYPNPRETSVSNALILKKR